MLDKPDEGVDDVTSHRHIVCSHRARAKGDVTSHRRIACAMSHRRRARLARRGLDDVTSHRRIVYSHRARAKGDVTSHRRIACTMSHRRRAGLARRGLRRCHIASSHRILPQGQGQRGCGIASPHRCLIGRDDVLRQHGTSKRCRLHSCKLKTVFQDDHI